MRHVDRSVGICSSALAVSLLAAPRARARGDAVLGAARDVPVSQMHAGMTGVGHTVIKGTTVEQFDVEFLGVLPDYIFLGIDIIVMRMTGPAGLVETTGGAVAGMSGSPVYINGKLAGALAWAVAEDRRISGSPPPRTWSASSTSRTRPPWRKIPLAGRCPRRDPGCPCLGVDADRRRALESRPVPLGFPALPDPAHGSGGDLRRTRHAG